jgi:hypothetical protein
METEKVLTGEAVGGGGDGGKVGKWRRRSRRTFPGTMNAQASSRLFAWTATVSATARTKLQRRRPPCAA